MSDDHGCDDALISYMQAHTSEPFKARAAMEALADYYRNGNHSQDPKVSASVKKMRATSAALNGVCHLHVDLAWTKALRETPWRKRRKFRQGEGQWKADLRQRLIADAERDIAKIS